MKIHQKNDQTMTSLQWLKLGFKVKKGCTGTLFWTNGNCKVQAVYYSRDEVRRSSVAIRDYKKRLSAQRKARYEKQKGKLFRLPLPADALKACTLPNYDGWVVEKVAAGKVALVLDTETTGLYPDSASLLQLSWQVVDMASWEILSEHNYYFQYPKNQDYVSTQAIQINQLNEAALKKYGTSSLQLALYMLDQDLAGCHYLVAHNIRFDSSFIEVAAQHIQEQAGVCLLSNWFNPDLVSFCTMRETKELCCLPHRTEPGVYKYPKLVELADFLEVSRDGLDLHNASADVELTKRCFMRLSKMNTRS